ncbi:MAG: patatin-like phospholipase family protein [Deltaproteobacteria bacterium]|nr:patatin-like phospholipase family protein [Deltaproteobacteria bacterium]
MAERKRVFILGGGASFGAHHVGAMQYLDEQGIRPDAIIGSSIGVINACLYATGGVENMIQSWSDFDSRRHLFTPSLRHNLITGLSVSSVSRLERSIERFVDYEKIMFNPVETAFIILNLSQGAGQIWSSHDAQSPAELQKIVRAGYAIPFLYPPVRIRGDWCVDGGFAWNIPLDHAIHMKATEIYVLTVIPHQLPFKRKFTSIVDYAGRFMDVMWRTLGNAGYLNQPIVDGKYQGIPVTLIQPGEEMAGLPLLDLFNVHAKKSRRLIKLGYRDAKRILSRGRQGSRKAASDALKTATQQAALTQPPRVKNPRRARR